jgi:cation diffusion facilitator CzcD-associated flavoprotein CzcO
MTMIAAEVPDLCIDPVAAFCAWVQRLSTLMSGRTEVLAEVFEPDGYWKDILSFGGRHTRAGHDDIKRQLLASLSVVRPTNVRLAASRAAPRRVRRSGRVMIEGYFDFDTAIGSGTGFARLLLDESDPMRSRAWIVLTTLQQLAGYEERIGTHRPSGIEYSMNFAGDNWLDKRRKAAAYADRDPEVLIVGGAQSGLILAARLVQRGVDALVVEKSSRLGDVWRHRYHSLTLHNEVWANAMPYMPFPSTWPTFVPKDKLAGWLEYYAEAMEINAWTSTEVTAATYDAAKRRWNARLKRADGSERTITVKHLVLATGGVSGVPKIPPVPGLNAFTGEVLHSSKFSSGVAYRSKNAIVIGTGTSGHDVAQDLSSNGAASVTMIQRSPTCVISLVPGGTMVYAVYGEGPPPEDIDLLTASVPYPVMRDAYQWLTKKTCALDKKLLDGLRAAGFELSFGEDDTGFYMLYLRRGGGYYLNVGCSDLIAAGKIGIVQHRNLVAFSANALHLKDGSIIPADVVVLATGFDNQQENVRRLLGDEIADRVGPIWGFDEEYTMRNMWRRTAQEALWIMGGSLIDARLNSTFLALEILSELRGVHYRGDNGNAS